MSSGNYSANHNPPYDDAGEFPMDIVYDDVTGYENNPPPAYIANCDSDIYSLSNKSPESETDYKDQLDSSDDEASYNSGTGSTVEVEAEIESNGYGRGEQEVDSSFGSEKTSSNHDSQNKTVENNNVRNESGNVRRQRRSGVVNEYEPGINSPTYSPSLSSENSFFPENETKSGDLESNEIVQCNSDTSSVYSSSGRKSILRNGDKTKRPSYLLLESQNEDRKISTASSIGIQIDFKPEVDIPNTCAQEEDESRKLSVASSLTNRSVENNNNEEKFRKLSDISGQDLDDCDLGHVNEGYLSDTYLDNITKQLDTIIEKSKEKQLQLNGDCSNKKTDGRRRKSSEVRFSEIPDVKIEYDAYDHHHKPYYSNNNNGSTDSFDTKSGHSLADHVRKDSIALTKENMGQIERIKKEFAMRVQQKPIWKRKSKALKQYRLHIGVTVLFVLTMIFVSIGWHFHKKSTHEKAINQKIFFEARKRTIRLSDIAGNDHITGILGMELPNWQIPAHCSDEPDAPESTCLKWKGNAILRIKHFVLSDVNCYNVSWKSLRPDFYPHDCINIDSASWFGLSNLTNPVWPLQGVNFTFSSSSSNIFDLNTFNSAIEYYWISSDAGAIMVDNSVPLIVNWNITRNSMCLIANYTGEFYGYLERPSIYLNYSICNGIDTLKTHKAIRGLANQYPTNFPERSIFQSPIWSTQGEAKTMEISDTDLEGLLKRIKQAELNCSSIELDGKWEAHQGDLEFDSKKFPNISKLAQVAKQEGCGLSLIINPYISYTSRSFSECLQKGYFLKGAGGNVPGFINIENTIAAMLDVSNPTARSWFTGKLMALASKYGIDSFHLHYGESSWIPYHPKYTANGLDANKILKMFSEMMMSVSDEVILDGTAQSQHLPAFQRASTKIEKTDKGFCLTGTIPSALTLGLLGYPFVLADGSFIIKKTKYNNHFSIPTRNLYIRWLQLTAFFPAMKYAVTPWSYDNDCLEVAKKSSDLHLKHVIPAIDAIKDKIPAGDPILRPVWWIDPKDKNLYTIEDQFLVGDDIMVAPVLCEGQTSRMIYFPAGLWQDQNDLQFFQGSQWKLFNVSLYSVPYFKIKHVL